MKTRIPLSIARRALTVLGILLVAGAMAPSVSAAGSPTPIETGSEAASLSSTDLGRLSEAAVGIRSTLRILRELEASPEEMTPAAGEQLRALHKRLEEHLGTFLAISGLSRQDFVRLMDQDAIDPNETPGVALRGEPAELRPLTEVQP